MLNKDNPDGIQSGFKYERREYIKMICRNSPNKFSIIIFFLFCLSNVNAEVYKWIDENGKTVYGDKPTTGDADEIKIRRNPVQGTVVQDRNKKQMKLLDIMQQERVERDALRKDEKGESDKQEKMCADARKDLQEIKDARFLYQETDDPNNPIIMSDQERKAKELRFEKYIKKNC